MKIILCSDKTLVETFHETSLHLNSYLSSATPDTLLVISDRFPVVNKQGDVNKEHRDVCHKRREVFYE